LYSQRKLQLLAAAISLILIAFQIYDVKGGGGMVYIYYVETDRGTYELGQSVNVTAASYIQYDPSDPLQYSETVVSCKNGQSCLAFTEWLNETKGYHVHHSSFTLNPDDWSPGQGGQIGVAECSLCLQPDGTDEIQRQNFTVTRSAQICSLSKILPIPLAANTSTVSLVFRVFNRNNPTFGVGSNQIFFNITNPLGLPIITNNVSLSDPEGNLTISFDPNFTYGQYHIDLRSVENGKYLEGRFNYTLWVDRGPIPSSLNIEWNYAGIVINSSTSYALEPSEITVQLMNSIDKIGISNQKLDLAILDSSNLETVYKTSMTTNATGYATSNFMMPYEGEFIPQVSYEGLVNAWYPASKVATSLIKAEGRDLSIVELLLLPQTVTLNHSYPVRYLILDALSEKPVPGLAVTVKTGDSILAEGITDASGALDLTLNFPLGRIDLIGRTDLLVEARSRSPKSAFHSSALHAPLLCKLPTSIRLKITSQSIFEDGDTIVFVAQLLYLGNIPVIFQNLVFTVLINQVENPYYTNTRATDAQGTCSISLKLVEQGVVTIVVIFPGNSTFDSSSNTTSFSVLPAFHERLTSSGLTIVLAGFLSILSLVAIERAKRKTRWQDVSID
jgi:hypothetical protein